MRVGKVSTMGNLYRLLKKRVGYLVVLCGAAFVLLGCSGDQAAVAEVVTPPTVTPSAAPKQQRPTATPMPTIDYAATIAYSNTQVAQATQRIVESQTAVAQTQTAQPTVTPTPTLQPLPIIPPDVTPVVSELAAGCDWALVSASTHTAWPAYRSRVNVTVAVENIPNQGVLEVGMYGVFRKEAQRLLQTNFLGEFAYVSEDPTVNEDEDVFLLDGRYIDDVFYFNSNALDGMDENDMVEVVPHYALFDLTQGEVLSRLVGKPCTAFEDVYGTEKTLRYTFETIALDIRASEIDYILNEESSALTVSLREGSFNFHKEGGTYRLVSAEYDLSVVSKRGKKVRDVEFLLTVKQSYTRLDHTDTSLRAYALETEWVGDLPKMTFDESPTDATCADKVLVRYTNLAAAPHYVLLDGPDPISFTIPSNEEAWFCVTPGMYLENGDRERVRFWLDATTCYYTSMWTEDDPDQASGCSTDPADYQAPAQLAEDPSPNTDNPTTSVDPPEHRVVSLVNETDSVIYVSTYGNTCYCDRDFTLAPNARVALSWGSADRFFINVLRDGVLEDYSVIVINGGTATVTDDGVDYVDRVVTSDF